MERRFVAIVAGVVIMLVAVALVIARKDTTNTPSGLPITLGTPHAGGTADAALAPYGGIVYHLDAGVPPLDGRARAYRVLPEDPASAARRLGGAFGLHGDPTADGDTVTVTDGPAQLTVTAHDWSYSRDPSGTVSSSATPQPQLTDQLPSQDDAKQLAVDLLGRAGVDTKGAVITTDLGDTQWFVRVDPVVDGVNTEGSGATVIVGEKGAIEAATGVLGAVTAADEYPLAGTKVAVDRLNTGEGLVGPQPLEAQDTPAIATGSAAPAGSDEPPATDEPPASDDAIPEGEASEAPPSAPGSAPSPPPDSEPPSTDTLPPPVPQDVTLTGVERILLFATGADGTNWLVPAYRFTTADGTGPTVLAVADRFLLGGEVRPTGR